MDFTSIVAVLGTMSISVERVVETIKNLVPALSDTQTDPKNERYRRAALHVLSFIVGTIIAYVAQEQLQPLLSSIFRSEGVLGLPGCMILGLLSSGGSGLWNQSLGIIEEIKKAKKIEVRKLAGS